MIRILKRFRMAIMILILAAAGVGCAQPPDITGIGLSGSRLALDTLIVEGDSVYAISEYHTGPTWHVETIGFHEDSLNVVRIHFYDLPVPIGSPIESRNVPVTNVIVDTSLRRVTFRLRLTDVVNPTILSLQMEMALWSRDDEGHTAASVPKTSHAAVGSVQSANSSVDALHYEYLVFRDIRTFPPVISAPATGSTVPRRFNIRYSLPEDAAPRSFFVTFRNIEATVPENPHSLRIRDLSAGTDKILQIDVAALLDPSQFDSLGGSPQLTDNAQYQITLFYRDVNGNPQASAFVDSVRVDRQTVALLLFEPRLGSYTNDSTVRVIYQLGEIPDTVWLTFALDSSFIGDSTVFVDDTLSPHILILNPSLYGTGITSFFLDGRDIGSNSPYVDSSNRGANDRLIPQCIYRVTLSCGDTVGNENASAANSGYVWPNDQTTLPPTLLQPADDGRFNQNFRITFRIPETPQPGSVYLRFLRSAGTPDPGTPHRVYIRNPIVGWSSFFLDATQLGLSEMVDSVTGNGTPEQNNTLVDSTRYLLRLYYRDSLGNAENFSNPATILFDNHTEPPTIYTPQEGDTLGRAEVLVRFALPETAPSATLRLVLERTGGVEDLGSPHTLYISDRTDSTNKEITLHPANLATSVGIDSAQGGAALVSRAIYRLRIECRDTLLNEWASAFVSNLVYPSGTFILAEGEPVGTGFVIPGNSKTPCFRISLWTDHGESLLQGLRYRITGTVSSSDMIGSQIRLWASADAVLDDQDIQLDRLQSWAGGDIVFSSFASALSETPSHFFLTLSFAAAANPGHHFNVVVVNSSSIDCATDPVIATRWPIGTPDVALPVELTAFTTEQDTSFGSLRLNWHVASELDNAGFIVLRRAENESTFTQVASYTSSPELVGRGTDPSAANYQYVDRGLDPGRRYIYRLATESMNLEYSELELEAEGIPRLPPADFILGNAFPNPFNQVVTIPYTVPYTAQVEIRIYDLIGRRIRTLFRGLRVPADHLVQWNGCDDGGHVVPSGVYFFRMEADGRFIKTRKLLLVR